jgi:enoyl-CoA hydratase/3-hydroxyacyl-CoA dehydrogenase
MSMQPTDVRLPGVRPRGVGNLPQAAATVPNSLATARQSNSIDFSNPAVIKDILSLRFGATTEGVSAPRKDFIQDMQQRGVLVLGGAGIMGNGIAVNHMMAGIPAYIYDVNDAAVQGGIARLEKEINGAATPRKPGQEALITQQEAQEARARLKGTFTDLGGVKPENGVNPGIVIEAVFEDMALKKKLFKQLDEQLPPDTILASNTSSLSIAEMAKATSRPDKVIGIHFFKPANRNRFIEVIPGPQTSEETVKKAMALVRALGKTPILCQDAPGFVVNRLLIPAMNEGVRMLDQGISNTATIEQTFMETVWPNAHKDPKIAKGLLGPFGGQNQDNYIWIIGKTTQVLHDGLKDKYGNSYAPTQTVVDKFNGYEAALARSKANGTPLDQELASVRYKLEGAIQEDKKGQIRDRFLGLVFGVATQLVEEGVTTPEDVDRGVQAALKWEIGPFDLMNKLGPKKSLQLVESYAATNPGFKVPDILKAQAKSGKAFPLSFVDSRKEGSTQVITFNRPQAHGLNYLNPAMLESLRQAYRKAEKDPTVKTIVFESVGGKAFISGADIFALGADLMAMEGSMKGSRMLKLLPKKAQRTIIDTAKYLKVRSFVKQGADVIDEIARSKKVTIAKVSGLALGGGVELPLACDYIFASDKSKVIGLPETKYGIFPAWGGTERTAERIGGPLSRFLILEGGQMGKGGKGPAILTAQEAKEIGLVDDVLPALDLDRVVKERLDAGAYSTKRARRVVSADTVLAKLSPRWAAVHQRYATASLKDLTEKELKGLYYPALKLADARIERAVNGKKNSRIQQEKDLLAMAQNMAGADRAAKKAAAEKAPKA